MAVRAKMSVASLELYSYPVGSFRVKLSAVYDDGIPENSRFAQATPSGECSLYVTNPPAIECFKRAFEEKKAIYVDFFVAE